MFGDVITMGDAVVVCLFSLAVVFLVLLAISYMIDLVHYLLTRGERKPAAPAPAAPAAPAPAAPVAAAAPARDDHADAVLVAAAVAAYLGTTTDQFVVRSIRRLVPEESPWVQASRMNRRDAR